MTAGRAGFLLLLGIGACRARETPDPRVDAPIQVNDADGGAGQSEPSIAVDGNGRTLLAAWVDWSDAVPHVRLARSTNGGASFGVSRRIDANALHTRGQAEATLGWNAGRFAFGWIGCRPDAESLENHACDVYATTSSDGGVTWAVPHAIAEGGSPRRDRPWVIADGERFGIAWSEVATSGVSWKYARESARSGGVFTLVASIDGRTAVQPPSATAAGVEVLLVDHTARNPRGVTLERRLAAGDAGSERWTFPPEAALLPYSLGAFASRDDGEAWVAIPEGTGDDGDLTLLHRAPGESFRETRGLRSAGGSRVGLPWIVPVREPGRFLSTWIEESPEGWDVRARVLGPGVAVSRPADVSRAAFRFQEASRTRNVGDFLSAATAGDAFWVAWSDTRDGDADIWIARGKIP